MLLSRPLASALLWFTGGQILGIAVECGNQSALDLLGKISFCLGAEAEKLGSWDWDCKDETAPRQEMDGCGSTRTRVMPSACFTDSWCFFRLPPPPWSSRCEEDVRRFSYVHDFASADTPTISTTILTCRWDLYDSDNFIVDVYIPSFVGWVFGTASSY